MGALGVLFISVAKVRKRSRSDILFMFWLHPLKSLEKIISPLYSLYLLMVLGVRCN